MDNKTKKILRIIGLLLCIILLGTIGKLLYNYNIAKRDEIRTPVKINAPLPQKEEPQEVQPQVTPEPIEQEVEKPFTRDENDMPKSDVKVPEIG